MYKKIIPTLFFLGIFLLCLVKPVFAIPMGSPATFEKTCTKDSDCPETYCIPPSGSFGCSPYTKDTSWNSAQFSGATAAYVRKIVNKIKGFGVTQFDGPKGSCPY